MTFDKLMKKWISDNNLKMSVGYDRFGKSTFWNWCNAKSVPYDNKITDIADKTGLSFNVITDSINESKKKMAMSNTNGKSLKHKRPEPSTNTIGKMLGEWLEINSISRKQAREIFGYGFDTWIIDKCAPHKTRIKEISDKTGFTEDEIREGIKNTEAYIKGSEPKKEPEKEPEHTMDELINEADAVRKLKAGLAALVTPETITAQVVHSPLELTLDDSEFDTLVISYAEAYKQRCDVENEMKALQDKLDQINSSLNSIKNKIRSVA